MIFCGAVALLALYVAGAWAVTKYARDEEKPFFYIVGPVLSVFPGGFLIVCTGDFLKVIVAPRVVVLEYLSNLVK